jgi:hypothetical protein
MNRSRGALVSHPKGLDQNTSAGYVDSGDGERDKPVLCSTVEQRIRSGGKSEGCKAREVNASERRKPSVILRGTSRPAVIQQYRSQPSAAHGARRERRAIRWGTETKPSLCSNRDSDWMDRRAWSHSTSCSVGLASLRTCSPQIADPTGRPWLQQ